MSIRLPVDASQNVQAAFRDVEQELEDLKAAVAALSGGTDLTSINERIDRIQPPPQLDSDKFTFVGSGPQHSVGLVPDPGLTADAEPILTEQGWGYPARGLVRAVTTLGSVGDTQGPADTVNVLGNLAVLNTVGAGEVDAGYGKFVELSDTFIQQRSSDTVPVRVKTFATLVDAGTAPNGIAGLSGWWKADAGVYEDAGTDLAETTDPVYQWNDQSGNNRHFSQATLTNRPTYVTGVVNGYPVIRFDGVDNFMATTATIDDFMSSTAGTIFVVAYVHAITTAGANAYANDQVFSDVISGPGVRHCLALTTTPTIVAFHYDGSEDTAAKTVATGTWYSMLYMMSGGSLFIGLNDAQTASLTSTASGAATSVAGTLRLAVNYDGSIFTQIDIAEMAIYDAALTEANRLEVEKYFAAKYGITIGHDTTEYSNNDLFRIEKADGSGIVVVDNQGDLYVKGVQVN